MRSTCTAARELREALREFAADADVRVVLLAAEGADFCAGADLAALHALLDASASEQLQGRRGARRCLSRDARDAAGRRRRGARARARGRRGARHGLRHRDRRRRRALRLSGGARRIRAGDGHGAAAAPDRREARVRARGDGTAGARARGARARTGEPRRPERGDFERCRRAARERARRRCPPHALRSTKQLFYSLDATNFEDGIAHAVRVNVEARSTDEFREGVRRFAPGNGEP